MTKFFWSSKGINADIERHREKEKQLDAKIAQLEKEDQKDPMVIAGLRAYKRFKVQLEISKAEVVAKLGRKK